MPSITSVKIYPSIGIARLGNSPDWYLGPEVPFPAPPPLPPDGAYKDTLCRVKRQAQRFRLFATYDDASVKELTAADGPISWTVHLANAKGQHQGDGAGPVPRIDPGPRTLSGANGFAAFDTGTYQNVVVPLGEMRTDAEGRLIVCGGFGNSGSPTNQPIVNFEVNPGWYDDVSDGPVNATITVGGTAHVAAGAWVICPPPRYAPTVGSVISLYDALRQLALDATPPQLPPPGQPSFTGDVLPILQRALDARRVVAGVFGANDNAPAGSGHGTLTAIIPPGPNPAAQLQLRTNIFNNLADPSGGGTGDMPLLQQGTTDPIRPTLRPFQYAQMQRWSTGDFSYDGVWPPAIRTDVTPDGMTQAALENCVGGTFYPGIEAGINVRTLVYTEAFRLDPTNLRAGDMTSVMARPWQSDFNACTGGSFLDELSWWPAARPQRIYPQGSEVSAEWTRDIITQAGAIDMVDSWYRLGFIVPDPDLGVLVETERRVVCKDAFFVVDRSTFSSGEVAAMLQPNPNVPATIASAFFLVIEGYAPHQIGITSAHPNASELTAWAPKIVLSPVIAGLTVPVTPNGMLLEDDAHLDQAQRVTFGYDAVFANTAGFTALPKVVTMTALVTPDVKGEGEFELIQQPSPYMIDGATSWLSTDLRVFQVQPNGAPPGQTMPVMGATAADATTFIKHVIDAFNGFSGANHPFDAISTDQNTSRLELSEKVMVNNVAVPVFNFAVARVRYRSASQPATARVFFRTFQTASASTNFELGTSYRQGGQLGTPIPLLGIQSGELVTIPFFAEPRANLVNALATMNSQQDQKNVQTLLADAGGKETFAYFGCWLDINQPGQSLFPTQPSPADGPFGPGRQPIQSLIRGLHQCLVAEIVVAGDPIPNGISPAASDKLAQRNLAIVESDNPGSPASHRVQHTFEMRHTRAGLERHEKPDELMIAWGATPPGCVATLYLPGLRAADVLALAGTMYERKSLERVDDHTLRCTTGGVTYVPIPAGYGPSIAGLLTIDLPKTVRRGQTFHIVVRQLTTEPAALRVALAMRAFDAPARERENLTTARVRVATPNVRRSLGAFQITVPVTAAAAMLAPESRALSVLRAIHRTIPPENRWHLVMRRYLRQIADRVRALGGDPALIGPSGSGEWSRDPRGRERADRDDRKRGDADDRRRHDEHRDDDDRREPRDDDDRRERPNDDEG